MIITAFSAKTMLSRHEIVSDRIVPDRFVSDLVVLNPIVPDIITRCRNLPIS